jgi:hypothetical protein
MIFLVNLQDFSSRVFFFSNALPVANLMILALAWVLLAEKSIVLALRASIAESKPKFTKDANCLRPGLPRKCGNL